ncbi:MAG TPA: arginine decarboxylase [Ruminiclostridium sp.]|nr:arginine decarboxylase [Ruminiclostridium sp.]
MPAPIYEMLIKYRESRPLAFHMPGHILGRGLSEPFKEAGSLDITEIPGADCLHAPLGVIREAQELAANCFGADFSLFLVNGSTAGIHTMIRYAVNPGGKLIIGRDCHISALNALALAHGEPIFVAPKVDREHQIPVGITAEDVEEALKAHPDAQGILVTRPNYYGMAQPLAKLAGLARRYQIPLLVDEAHGAHFKFHHNFPDTAMELGAHLCVQSLHKTLPAFTQTAILHGKKDYVDRRRVELTASMLQTTSPSYLLMASIDQARELMERNGGSLYDGLWENIRSFDAKLVKTTCLERVTTPGKEVEADFSRIVLDFAKTSLSGFQAEELLRGKYGIVAEMADLRHVVLIATPFHIDHDFDRLLTALQEMSRDYGGCQKGREPILWPVDIPERVISLSEALFSEKRQLPVQKSEGAIAADSLIPYPPGIPLVNPGERITADIIQYICLLLSQNCPVHGVDGGKIQIVDTGAMNKI